MEINAEVKINREELINAISNALYYEFTINNNYKKVSEMTCYELASYLPEVIANEISKDAYDIFEGIIKMK